MKSFLCLCTYAILVIGSLVNEEKLMVMVNKQLLSSVALLLFHPFAGFGAELNIGGNRQHQQVVSRKQQMVQLQSTAANEIICQHTLTTTPVPSEKTSTSYGILFTLSSPYYSSQSYIDNKEEIMTITSLGFYVDIDELSSSTVGDGNANYEVYTLKGHYADPRRTNGLPLNSDWDYRGNTTYWKQVASGSMSIGDLRFWPPTTNNLINGDYSTANYFQVPFEEFQDTTIQSVQSFYVTMREVGALKSTQLGSWEDFQDEQQQMLHCGGVVDDAPLGVACTDAKGISDKPILYIGESVVSYPFSDLPYFYQPRKFMGSVYYLNKKCSTQMPSDMPSISLIPSLTLTPSYAPMFAETMIPSRSLAPTLPPSNSQPPSNLAYIDLNQDGCHSFISTDRDYDSFQNETLQTYGIVFAMQSQAFDDDGVWITSFGFHVNLASISDGGNDNNVMYELYALTEDGIYADPIRTSAGAPETFDYRGNFSLWHKISTGTVSKEVLVSDYFQIPWGELEPIFIPPNGGIRSMYLTTLNSAALVYSLSKKNQLGSIQKDVYKKDDDRGSTQHPPYLMYGERVIGYPFHTSSFLYSPSSFIGNLFYEYECPSSQPSSKPSEFPSEMPSLLPSHSPSKKPSAPPSWSPSGAPSFQPR